MFEYQGGVYPGVWVYDGSGAQIVGVRLYLTPTVLSDPIPLSQVRIVGSTVGGIINSSTPPLNPPPGTVWFNAGPGSVNGIPAGNYAYWNGTQWVLMGTTAPNPTPIASNAAPTNPALGAIWQNTSGQTVAGIPSGGYAYWNGSTWVSLGSSSPQLGTTPGGAGVSTVNNLQGNVTLAEGSGIDITQSGNVITFTATGLAGGTPGVSSLNGQTGAIQIAGAGGLTVGVNAGTVTLTAPPPGQSGVATFNGRSGAVTPVAGDYPPSLIGAATPAYVDGAIASHLAATDPHAQYLQPPEVFGTDFVAANAAPTGPQTGQIWRNTSTNTVAGIPAGNWAVYNGTTWRDAGTRYPFAVNSGNVSVSTLAPGANNTWLNTDGSGQVSWRTLSVPPDSKNPGALASSSVDIPLPIDTIVTLTANTEVIDALSAYNPTTGIFTVPVGYAGIWDIGASAGIVYTNLGPVIYFYFSKNATTVTASDTFANSQFAPNGFRRVRLEEGDQIRWFALAAGGNQWIRNLNAYAFLVYQ